MKNQEIYIPGDKWLYFLIYTGYDTSDKLISSVLHPLAQKLIRERSAESWFFIRYTDPDHHLRFRIKLTTADSSQKVISSFNEKLKSFVDQKLVWKVELATYIPEVERYGKSCMHHAERIFFADSEAFAHLLKGRSIKSDVHLRWLFALASVNQYLKDFKISSTETKNLLLDLNRNFGKEFNKDKHLARQLSQKYREQRNRIISLLEEGGLITEDRELSKILTDRSKMSTVDTLAILEIYREEDPEVILEDLLSSFIHMTMNRIFQNNNRLHEMVLYDFLFRYYKSSQERKKYLPIEKLP